MYIDKFAIPRLGVPLTSNIEAGTPLTAEAIAADQLRIFQRGIND